MIPLTTHQRDLLRALLAAPGALGAAELGEPLGLSARQVHYNLRAVEKWLAQHKSRLEKQPGLGVLVSGPARHKQLLLDEFDRLHDFQLVLTSGQRQQLLALDLLLAREPHILYQLQRDVDVSRTTVFKDLEQLDRWFERFGLTLTRRPNYGCRLEGSEWQQRQALAALLWGDVPFDDPLLRVTHAGSIAFVLADDARLLPIVERTNAFILACDPATTLAEVVRIEAELDDHFTDDALLQLALALAVQGQRLAAGCTLVLDEARLAWLQPQRVWWVAEAASARLWPARPVPPQEIGAIAMQLLAGAREARWASTHESDSPLHALIADLMPRIAALYGMPEMQNDVALHNSLAAQIIPAVMRKRFAIWTPPAPVSEALTAKYAFEREVAQKLATVIAAHTGVILPDSDLQELVFLLRAAFIRERPTRPHRILVICPSGMAMSQLLLARLKARFPRLGTFELRSLRELHDETVAAADLIITTVPLYRPVPGTVHVIQVHPMLSPADIQAITEWMS